MYAFWTHYVQNYILGTHNEIGFWWIPQNLKNKSSKLVQVMAWCRQAPSHYLSQCWHRSMSAYGFTRPQCISTRTHLSCSQYHGCWCLVNTRSQGIASHDLDLVLLVLSIYPINKFSHLPDLPFYCNNLSWQIIGNLDQFSLSADFLTCCQVRTILETPQSLG